MIKRISSLFSLLLAFATCLSFAADPILSTSLALRDCYELAIKQSERLLQAQQNIEQSKLRRRQSLGAVLPSLHWYLASTVQDTSNSRSGSGEFSSDLLDRWRNASEFTAKQPLFSGFKEFAAMSAYKAEQRKNEALLMRESVNLYMDVATAFYRVLQLEQFQADTRVSIGLTQDRVKELRERSNLGKSRQSEILSAESQLGSLQSQEAVTGGDILSARYVLGFLIGRNAQTTVFTDTLPYPTDVASEDNALRLGLNRSDIRALREDVEMKRYGVRVAKSGYYPYANLVGNYYTERPGFQSEVKWDVTFNLDVPIYQGGSVKSFADQAKSLLQQSELELQRGMRFADAEIQQARESVISSINQTRTLDQAYAKAKKSYDVQVREYRLGIVTNLDVLAALNAMQQVKVALDTALLQTKLNVIKLKAVTEEIP